MHENEQEKLIREILFTVREDRHLLRRILRHLDIKHFTIDLVLLETPMSIGNIVAGTTAQVGATLLENGAPYTPPAGSKFVFTPSLASSDPEAVVSPATADASGGKIPLTQQFLVTVAAGDTSGSVTLTPSGTDPNGNAITGTPLVIPITAEPQVFTIALSQLA